jgi:hypothetical protein
VWCTLAQGVHVSSWCKATFGNYQFVGEASLFLLACTLLEPRVKNQLEIFMHEAILGTNYINSREMFCEMVIEAYPKGYTISRLHRVQINKPNFCSMFTKSLNDVRCNKRKRKHEKQTLCSWKRSFTLCRIFEHPIFSKPSLHGCLRLFLVFLSLIYCINFFVILLL